MYKTLEEVENEFPIGTVFGNDMMYQRFYCANDLTLEKIKTFYAPDEVERVSPHHVVVKRQIDKTVDGYIFDGKNWFPATRAGHQWEVCLDVF